MEAISLALGAVASGAPFTLTLGALSNLALGVGVLVMFSVIMLFWGLQRSIDVRRGGLDRRLRDAGVVAVGPDLFEGGKAKGKKIGRQRRRVEVDQSRTFTYRMASELAQADLRITVGEFLAISGVLASVGALIGLAMPLSTLLGRALLALLLMIAGIYGPRIWVTRRRKARGAKFNEQLPDMINMMAGACAPGTPSCRRPS